MARTDLSVVFSVLLVVAGLAACSQSGAVPEATLEPCRSLVLDPAILDPGTAGGDSVDPLGLVLEAVAAARTRDTRCGPPNEHQRLCRALWLAQQLDPLPLVVTGEPVRAEHADAVRWALEEGAAASQGELSRAFIELSQANAELMKLAPSETELASIVLHRASASILEPLRAAERRC